MPFFEISLGFWPTPRSTVETALGLAGITSDDIIFDLGSGDGRIIIAAAEIYGARGVGIEIDPALVEASRTSALRSGVQNLVRFTLGDLFEADIGTASVVFLALMLEANLELRSRLITSLGPGSRIIAFNHGMRDWEPEKQIEVDGQPIYLWRITEVLKLNPKFAGTCTLPVHSTRKVGNRTIYFWTRET
jgi:SAM-dependent methyltransferase